VSGGSFIPSRVPLFVAGSSPGNTGWPSQRSVWFFNSLPEPVGHFPDFCELRILVEASEDHEALAGTCYSVGTPSRDEPAQPGKDGYIRTSKERASRTEEVGRTQGGGEGRANCLDKAEDMFYTNILRCILFFCTTIVEPPTSIQGSR
jgi:hypothetical protein